VTSRAGEGSRTEGRTEATLQFSNLNSETGIV
jgi:hypothetical protein